MHDRRALPGLACARQGGRHGGHHEVRLQRPERGRPPGARAGARAGPRGRLCDALDARHHEGRRVLQPRGPQGAAPRLLEPAALARRDGRAREGPPHRDHEHGRGRQEAALRDGLGQGLRGEVRPAEPQRGAPHLRLRQAPAGLRLPAPHEPLLHARPGVRGARRLGRRLAALLPHPAAGVEAREGHLQAAPGAEGHQDVRRPRGRPRRLHRGRRRACGRRRDGAGRHLAAHERAGRGPPGRVPLREDVGDPGGQGFHPEAACLHAPRHALHLRGQGRGAHDALLLVQARGLRGGRPPDERTEREDGLEPAHQRGGLDQGAAAHRDAHQGGEEAEEVRERHVRAAGRGHRPEGPLRVRPRGLLALRGGARRARPDGAVERRRERLLHLAGHRGGLQVVHAHRLAPPGRGHRCDRARRRGADEGPRRRALHDHASASQRPELGAAASHRCHPELQGEGA
mmetsp:Transcript_67142/g.197071  ORF Transcript_67142/g.197071 Transcript_67142/m.197071 type:complete len:458 (+) Transcript_67142:1084-2457(+)